MTIRSIFLGTITCLVILSGCGGGAKLTEEQKAKFKELQKNTGSVISSAKSAQSGKSALAVGDSGSLESRIQAKINSGACTMQTPSAESLKSSGIQTVNVKMEGANCPIVMDIGITGNQSGGQVKIYFEIKDEELKQLSDVTQMDLSGSISVSGKGGSGRLTGYIQSKKFGRVGLSMDISGNDSSANIDVTYSFADFDVKIGIQASADGVKFKLNGSDISQEELQQLMEGGGLVPGMQNATPSTGGGTTTNSSLSYNLTENGCSTGQQQFSSEAALCEGLQSESRNHGCAESLRRSTFQSHNCPGTFQTQP